MKKGNVLFGTIGAIIGSFAGVALYVGISLLKVFSSWSGAISLYCAIFMYTLFSRKLTKLGVVISIIVSCASMILAEVITTCILIANKYHIPFFEVFKNFLKVYPKIKMTLNSLMMIILMMKNTMTTKMKNKIFF